jgi:hypothetical protein
VSLLPELLLEPLDVPELPVAVPASQLQGPFSLPLARHSCVPLIPPAHVHGSSAPGTQSMPTPVVAESDPPVLLPLPSSPAQEGTDRKPKRTPRTRRRVSIVCGR